jgi:glycosyltransferase involved in cell wall biosynthesis
MQRRLGISRRVQNKMKKGKIDVITKYFYPIAAGIETNILETYSVLAKRGWDITIHTSKDTYLKKNHLPSHETIRKLKIKRYLFNSEVYGYMPEIDWGKTNIVALHNFNVSHMRILFKILWLKINREKKFKLIITPHGGFNPEWKIFDLPTRIMKFVYQYTLGVLLAKLTSDGFRAVSVWERKEMVKKGLSPEKIEVISNGLENEAYMDVDKLASLEIKKIVKHSGKYLIQIGRIYPIKNYETVIRALPSIPKEVNYLIVGQDEKSLDYKQGLVNLAKELGVNDRLKFLGVIRGVDKYYLIRHAKAMVHMAIWESFCNVVHEAMSQGTVCIVANNTALPLLIKNRKNGYLVNTHDHKILAKTINKILSHKNMEEIMKIKTNEKNFVKNNTWTKTAEKLERFILK